MPEYLIFADQLSNKSTLQANTSYFDGIRRQLHKSPTIGLHVINRILLLVRYLPRSKPKLPTFDLPLRQTCCIRETIHDSKDTIRNYVNSTSHKTIYAEIKLIFRDKHAQTKHSKHVSAVYLHKTKQNMTG